MPMYDDEEEDRDKEEAERILEEAGLSGALENLERGTSAALSGDDNAPSATQEERPEPFPIERSDTQREADRIVEEAGVDRSLSAFPRAPIMQAPPAPPPELRAAAAVPPAAQEAADTRAVTRVTASERASALGSPMPPAAPPVEDDAAEAAAVDAIAARGAEPAAAPETPGEPAETPEPAAVAESTAAPPQPLAAPPAASSEDQAEAAAVDAIAAGTESPPQPLAPVPAEEELADAGALDTLAGGPPPDRAAALGSPTAKPEAVIKEGGEGDGGGIPTESDIAGARTRDFFRRGLGGGLVAALRGLAGGRATADVGSEAERLLADRQRLLGEKRTARQEEAAATATAAQRARELRELGLRERQLTQQGDIARANAARQSAAAESQAASARTTQALNEEQLRGRVSERELAERRRLQDSQETIDARANARATLSAGALQNTRRQAQLAPILNRIDSMTAEQIDNAMEGEWRSFLPRQGGIRIGTGGGGGGAGSAAVQGLVSAYDSRIDALEQRGTITTERANGLRAAARGSQDTRRELSGALDDLERTTQQGVANERADTRLTQATQAQELIPGSGIRAGGRIAEGAVTDWRNGFADAMSNMSTLRSVARIADRYQGARAFGPEAAAELNPQLTLMRGMVAEMGRTGVINSGEVQTINDVLPNPTAMAQNDMTFGTFRGRLRTWREMLESRVRAKAVSLGVSPEDQDRIVRSLRQGGLAAASLPEGGGGGGRAPGAAQPAASSTRFRVYRTGPDGREQSLPRELTEAEVAAFRGENDQPRSGFRIEEVR